MMDAEVDYSRVNALSDEQRDALRDICARGPPDPWAFLGINYPFRVLAVFLGVRDAGYVSLHRPRSRTDAACPLTPIAEAAGFHVAATETVNVHGDAIIRTLVISPNRDAVEAIEQHWDENPDSVPDTALGRALGYPEDAITAYVDGEQRHEGTLLRAVDETMDIPATESRYLSTCPFLPAPTESSVRDGIEQGKRIAAFIEYLQSDQQTFCDIPEERCPRLLSPDEWQRRIQRAIDETG